MNKEEIIEMIRDDNTPKELIIAQFETAFKYQMDLQNNIDILHNNQNKLIDEIGEQDKEIERLNKQIEYANKINNEAIKRKNKYQDIINELEKMFDRDLDGFQTINEKGACNDIIEVIQNYKDKLKELKEGK